MPRIPRISLLLPALAALAAAGPVLGAGPAEADPAKSCLWAGTAHTSGNTVTAGGRDYTCTADDFGAPMWSVGAPSHGADTVANPGSAGDPTGMFSLGARQPGTAFNDYCVGYQLIEGTGDVYQVVRTDDGTLFWRAAEPIDTWYFDRGTVVPQPTSRTSALCYEGNLA